MPKVFKDVQAAIEELESATPASQETIQAAVLLSLREIAELTGGKVESRYKRPPPNERPTPLQTVERNHS